MARKWRPKGFSKLVGQDVIRKTLLQALKLNRLPHALLFTGIRGTGKTSTARILAKHLRCLRSKDKNKEKSKEFSLKEMHLEPCNICKECLEIHTGQNPNVMEIDGASHNGVDAIRELSSHVLYVPSSGSYKVYIIDEVHMLSVSAFNALLKTLEEPPSHVFFILATTEVHKVPVTVLSRCQRFDFRRIPTPVIVRQLESICESENIKVEPQAFWLIARQSEGSLRDAESLLDQAVSFSSFESESDNRDNNKSDDNGSSDSNDDVKESTIHSCDFILSGKDVAEVFGLIDRTFLFEALQAILEQDTRGTLQVLEKLYCSGYDPGEFIKGFLEECRNILLIKLSSLSSVNPLLDLPEEEISKLKSLSSLLSEGDIHFLFDMALKGSHDVLQSMDSRIAMEMLLLRMTEAPRIENLHRWMEGGSLPSNARERES